MQMGSPAYWGKLANFTAAERKNALVPFGTFSPGDNISFVAAIPSSALPAIAPTPLMYSPSMVIDVATVAIAAFTVTSNCTSIVLNYNGNPSAIPDGAPFEMRITEDGTGGWTVALPTNLVVDTGFAVDPGAGRTTVISMFWNAANSRWILNDVPFSVQGA